MSAAEATVTPASKLRAGVVSGRVLLAAVIVGFLAESWAIPPQYDDSYISYRYAANLVAGDGLVYNVGEYVEGFSNLLWTLLVAGGLALGFEARAVGHALCLLGGVLTLGLTYVYAASGLRAEQRVLAAIAAALVYASPVFARWSIAGMETPLFAAFVVATLAAEAHARPGLATFAAVLATLTRPEGALIAACIFAVRLLEGGFASARVWRGPIVYSAALVALTLFRVAYYGDPLPNTYYAKVGGVALGISFVGACFFLVMNSGLLLLPAAAMLRDRRFAPGALYVAVMFAYAVSIGAGHRYLLPLIPCCATLGVVAAARAFERRFALGMAVSTGIALCFGLTFFGLSAAVQPASPGWLSNAARIGTVAREREEDAKGERLGARRAAVLRGRGEPIRLVATGAIGSFGFHSGLPVLDILGLIEPTVARSGTPAAERFSLPGHQRSNPDYIFAREPDYLLIGPRGKQRLGDVVTAPDELRAHPDLDRHYTWDAEVRGWKRVR